MSYRGPWLQTFSGGRFFPLDPRPEEVSLPDIAHALAHLCRFGGHCLTFYSVAQHSVLVSHYVAPHLAAQALLHDAAEAYLVDVPRPIKLALPDYRRMEKQIQAVIYRSFGLPERECGAIKRADDRVLAQEHRDLMARSPWDWSRLSDERPLDRPIRALPPAEAFAEFLERFLEIGFDKTPAPLQGEAACS